MLDSVLKKLWCDDDRVQAFISLLELTDCPTQKEFSNEVEVLEWLKSITQDKWKRKEGLERWQIDDSKYQEQNQKFIDLFYKLGLLNEIFPTRREYFQIVVLGACYGRTRDRIEYFKKLFDEKRVTCEGIVLLGSKRLLDNDKEKEAIHAECTTEFEMMNWSFTTIFGNKFQIPLISFDAENVKTPDGKETRAITDHTLDIYKNHLEGLENIQGKNILVISSNPYIPYQHAVACSKLGELGVEIETVGTVDLKANIAVTLDALARMIFSNYDRVKKEIEYVPQNIERPC